MLHGPLSLSSGKRARPPIVGVERRGNRSAGGFRPASEPPSIRFDARASGPNVAPVGLGLAIDYSLLVIFREELAHGEDVETAVVETMRHAGRSVMVSGSTVAIGLLSMRLAGSWNWWLPERVGKVPRVSPRPAPETST